MIATAREEYEANLLAIAKLEQGLLGRLPVHHKQASKCIMQVVPKDRTFTNADLLASLEAIEPRRNWNVRSVNEAISRMRRKGILKRVRRSSGTELAVYAVAELDVPQGAFRDMKLIEAIAAIVKAKPMRQIEIVLHLLEQGYETRMDKRTFRVAVGQSLREGDFVRKGKLWTCAG